MKIKSVGRHSVGHSDRTRIPISTEIRAVYDGFLFYVIIYSPEVSAG